LLKDYAEIHPKFLEEFEEELGYSWNLVDSLGNSHTITFNGDYAYPLLTEGWNNLREFYNYQGQKQILLSYLGRDHFSLTLRKTYELDFHPIIA
jgi:hypothetical protein